MFLKLLNYVPEVIMAFTKIKTAFFTDCKTSAHCVLNREYGKQYFTF